MVDVAARGATAAAGEPAGAVAGAEVAGEVGGDPVGGAAVGEEGAGLGVGEDALERGGVRGEPASGVGVDRAVAVEFGGLVGVPEQGEHGHGDEHSRHDRGITLDRFAVSIRADARQEEVGGGVEHPLRACAVVDDRRGLGRLVE